MNTARFHSTVNPLLFVVTALAAIFLAVSSCSSDDVASSPTTSPSTTPQPTPSPTTTPLPPLSATQIKYLLIDHYDGVFYCDPDYYPVARPGVEEQNAASQFPVIQADSEEYTAILASLGSDPSTPVTDELRMSVYREHKKLSALALTPSGAGYAYAFRIGDEGASDSFSVEGTVTSTGVVTETGRNQSFNTCPICLAADTLVSTPAGPLTVSAVRAGTVVWTLDPAGRRVAAEVIATGYTETPSGHELVHVILTDGRSFRASPGHPLADGRITGAIAPGDALDGAVVVSVERVPYGGQHTYDILPAGETGVYFAGGVPLGSTLKVP